jgi:hypothetical protein
MHITHNIILYNNKICLQGVCTSSPIAPVDTCPFGDDIVTQDAIQGYGITLLNSFQTTCQQIFAILTRDNKAISAYCSMPKFNSLCCQSCKSIWQFPPNKIKGIKYFWTKIIF